MRGKHYFKRVFAALLNQKPELPVGDEGVQALCDVILHESGDKRDEVCARLDALFAKQESALRQQITEKNNRSTVTRMETICRKAIKLTPTLTTKQSAAEPIPVVFICDDAYAVPTAVAILSMLSNKLEDTCYEITVLGRMLNEESLRLFDAFDPIVRVRQCAVEKHAVYANTHPHVSDAALLKFDIPHLLGEHDKVLYLDSDILVLGDLSALYATKLGNNFAAVIMDLLGTHYRFDQRTGVKHYFNSGVLLLNTKKMREDDISTALYQNKANDPWQMMMDQDTFNVTLKDNVHFLHPRYNLMYANNQESGWSTAKMAAFYGISEQQMQDAMDQPVIQHLSSKKKPWNSILAEKYLDYQEYRILLDLLLEQKE